MILNSVAVDDVCDYIILRLFNDKVFLNSINIHKLLYYIQAWFCAFYSAPLFPTVFQAWVHGPVCLQIYDRFSSRHEFCSRVTLKSVRKHFHPDCLPRRVRKHIDLVLKIYVGASDVQLIEMARAEVSWIKAGSEARAYYRRNAIDKETIAQYYRARIIDCLKDPPLRP